MRSTRLATTATLVLALAGCEPAPDARPSDPTSRPAAALADSIVRDWVERGVVAGAVLRASVAGRPLIERAYGWAWLYDYGDGQYGAWTGDEPLGIRRLNDPVPMSVDTRFDLASVTKVMATTFAVMLLVDDGSLDLDAPVSSWLSDFSEGDRSLITPRLLLTHRAGLAQWQPIYMSAQDPEGAYEVIRDLPLEWDPGSERHYSDLGFMLLGRIVEVISGQSLEAFLRGRLYGPLGLVATGFHGGPPDGQARYAATSHGNPFEYRMVHDTTFGYLYRGDPEAWDGWRQYTLAGEVNDGNAHYAFGGMAGHAGLFSTAAELDTLLQLLLHGGVYGGRRFLSPDVVRTFLTPEVEGQAIGWQVPPNTPPGSFAHTGFTGTYVAGVPASGLSLVLLTNRQQGGVDASTRLPDVDPLRRAVLEALLTAGQGPA